MPPQNPVARVEQVARDIGRLAAEIERYAGPHAKRTLLYWQSELQGAMVDIQRSTGERLTASGPGS